MTEHARLVISVDSTSARRATNDLRNLDEQSESTDRAAQSMTKSFSGLGKVLGIVGAGLSVRAIINASDEYGQMASRIRAATASTEEYTKVQDRLLQTANATYRPLQEAQEVYIRTADAIRSLGYNTDDALDITDSFSFLLVTNAASADRASSAIDAYSKAIQTGKVESDGWQSILAAMPTVVDDLAAATGRSGAEIRKLGIEGKLSLEALNEALRRSRDRNEELAAVMETSVADATTALSNSFQVFVGKVNETSRASDILTGSVEDLAGVLQDPETIKAAQELAGAIVVAFTKATEAIKGTINVAKFLGESIAAAVHGPALDDIPRLEDEIESVTKKTKNLGEELERSRLNRLNPFQSTESLEADYKKLQDRLAFLKKARDDFFNQPPAITAPEKTGTGGVKGSGGLVDSENDVETASRKALAALQREYELVQLTGEARARLLAIQKLGADALPEERAEAEKLAAQIYKLEESHRGAGKAAKDSANEQKRSTEQLLSRYESIRDTLARQVALYGETTEASRIRYEVENGDLARLNSIQKQHLVDLADELDAKRSLNDVDRLRLDILKETGQTRAANDLQFELDYSQKIAEYEKQGNVEALQRLETLKQIRETQSSQVDTGTVEGVSKAPQVKGVDAAVGGLGSELTRLDKETRELEDWRVKELEKQTEFLEARAISQEEYARRELNINQQTRDQLVLINKTKQDGLLASSSDFFGQMAVLSQSGNKRLGAIGKAAAIAQATISGFTAIQNALAVPPYPVGLALAVSAGVATAANIASIAGVGFKSGGYTGSGNPNDVAGPVHKGEFVFDAASTSRLGVDTLEAIRRGQIVDARQPASPAKAISGQPDQRQFQININMPSTSNPRESRESGAEVARRVANAVRSTGRYT